MKKFTRLFVSFICVCLVASFCVVGDGCSASADKYKPVYKYTNEAGKDIYDWPEGSETGMIDVPGGKVAYRVYGKDKKGTPLVCVHGGPGGNYSNFYKQISLAEDRPVILYDQLGSPLSEVDESVYNTDDKVKSLYTIDRYTEELDCVIKYFKLENFILYGTSWGCMLNMEYVGKYHPAGLKGMVFGGPFLDVDYWIADAQRLILSLDNGQEMLNHVRLCEQAGNYDDQFKEINSVFSKNFNNRHPDCTYNKPDMTNGGPGHIKVQDVDVYEYMWGKSEFSCTGTLQHHSSTQFLPDLNVPVIFIPGQYDEGTPQAAFYYASLCKKGTAEVAVIPGAGHSACQERPEEFNEVLSNFAKRIDNNEK